MNEQPFMTKPLAIWGAAAIVIVALVAAFLMFSRGRAQVTAISVAHGIDAQGNPVGQTIAFDHSKDHSVYVIVNLTNATKKTQVSYVRSYNGRYIDSKVTVPAKDGAQSVFFSFEKGIGDYPVGSYKIVTYIDGKRALDTSYSFQ